MATETRVKNVFIDVLFLMDLPLDFISADLVLTGQTFGIRSSGEVHFLAAALALNGQTFDIESSELRPRSMFFHF